MVPVAEYLPGSREHDHTDGWIDERDDIEGGDKTGDLADEAEVFECFHGDRDPVSTVRLNFRTMPDEIGHRGWRLLHLLFDSGNCSFDMFEGGRVASHDGFHFLKVFLIPHVVFSHCRGEV